MEVVSGFWMEIEFFQPFSLCFRVPSVAGWVLGAGRCGDKKSALPSGCKLWEWAWPQPVGGLWGNRLLTCGSSSLRADQRRGQSGPGELQTAGWRRGGEHQRGGTEQLPEGGRFLGERILQDPAAGGAQVGRTGGRQVPPAPPPPVKSLFFKPRRVDFMVPQPHPHRHPQVTFLVSCPSCGL